MNKILLAATLMFISIGVHADDLDNLIDWVKTQQINVGTGISLNGVKFETQWWDLIAIGKKGINIGKAESLDFIDFGPVLSLANVQRPRYGQAIPIHAGNIWNSITGKIPPSLVSHIFLASLPNITIAPIFLFPENSSLNKWRWQDDFQIAVAYKFGGN